MQSLRMLVHALDVDLVAQLADDAGLLKPADPEKPRTSIRILDDGGRRRIHVLELERHEDGTLIIQARGPEAVRFAQTIAELDTVAQTERQTERRTAAAAAARQVADAAAELAAAEQEKARARNETAAAAETAAHSEAEAAALAYAAAMGGEATPGAVTVRISPVPPHPGEPAQLVDFDLEHTEPPTPPTRPRRRSGK